MFVAVSARQRAERVRSPAVARALLLAVIVAAGAAGWLAGAAEAPAVVSAAGEDLTRLLRAMAALKAVLAVVASAAVWWRLGAAAGPGWLVAYALACGAMASGPGLIWSMAHIGAGALLLHAGLAACVLLLWRDKVVGELLAGMIAARRMRPR